MGCSAGATQSLPHKGDENDADGEEVENSVMMSQETSTDATNKTTKRSGWTLAYEEASIRRGAQSLVSSSSFVVSRPDNSGNSKSTCIYRPSVEHVVSVIRDAVSVAGPATRYDTEEEVRRSIDGIATKLEIHCLDVVPRTNRIRLLVREMLKIYEKDDTEGIWRGRDWFFLLLKTLVLLSRSPVQAARDRQRKRVLLPILMSNTGSSISVSLEGDQAEDSSLRHGEPPQLLVEKHQCDGSERQGKSSDISDAYGAWLRDFRRCNENEWEESDGEGLEECGEEISDMFCEEKHSPFVENLLSKAKSPVSEGDESSPTAHSCLERGGRWNEAHVPTPASRCPSGGMYTVASQQSYGVEAYKLRRRACTQRQFERDDYEPLVFVLCPSHNLQRSILAASCEIDEPQGVVVAESELCRALACAFRGLSSAYFVPSRSLRHRRGDCRGEYSAFTRRWGFVRCAVTGRRAVVASLSSKSTVSMILDVLRLVADPASDLREFCKVEIAETTTMPNCGENLMLARRSSVVLDSVRAAVRSRVLRPFELDVACYEEELYRSLVQGAREGIEPGTFLGIRERIASKWSRVLRETSRLCSVVRQKYDVSTWNIKTVNATGTSRSAESAHEGCDSDRRNIDDRMAVSSGQCISALHLEACKSALIPTRYDELDDIANVIFFAAVTPYVRLLERWLLEGTLHDPHGELFLFSLPRTTSRASSRSFDAVLSKEDGEEDFAVITAPVEIRRSPGAVPSFFVEIAHDILLSGTHLRFIRSLLQVSAYRSPTGRPLQSRSDASLRWNQWDQCDDGHVFNAFGQFVAAGVIPLACDDGTQVQIQPPRSSRFSFFQTTAKSVSNIDRNRTTVSDRTALDKTSSVLRSDLGRALTSAFALQCNAAAEICELLLAGGKPCSLPSSYPVSHPFLPFSLKAHLDALASLLCFADADLLSPWLDALFASLDECADRNAATAPGTGAFFRSEGRMTSLLQSCVETKYGSRIPRWQRSLKQSVCSGGAIDMLLQAKVTIGNIEYSIFHPEHVDGNLPDRSKDRFSKLRFDPLEALMSIKVVVLPVWRPMYLLIGPSTIKRFNDVFSLLLRLKFCRHLVLRARQRDGFCARRAASSFPTSQTEMGSKESRKKSNVAASRVFHVIRCLHDHCVESTVEAMTSYHAKLAGLSHSSLRFRGGESGVPTLVHIVRDVTRQVLGSCMVLVPDDQILRGYLLRITSSFCAYYYQAKSLRTVAARSWEDESVRSRQIMEKEFDRAVNFFLVLLEQNETIDDDTSSLRQLQTLIDFNFFFKAQRK